MYIIKLIECNIDFCIYLKSNLRISKPFFTIFLLLYYKLEYKCYSGSGKYYRGSLNNANGYQCQTWNSIISTPNTYTPSKYPHESLISNYCRNPGGVRVRPWCYTSNSGHWQLCDISVCKSKPVPTPPYPLGSKLCISLNLIINSLAKKLRNHDTYLHL